MQENYAGIDVSLELASVCIVDANGKVVKETKVESHPDALVALFNDLRLPLARIGSAVTVASCRTNASRL
jgi:transposase